MKQNGNALFLILIAVALFAALSYAVTQSGRGGGSIDRETASLEASQIVQFAGALQNAVQKAQLLSCSETDINFDTPALTGYDNTTAPSDGSCDIFEPSGGGLIYTPPPAAALDGSQSAGFSYADWLFTAESCVYRIGTGDNVTCISSGPDDSDLVAVVSWLDEEVCRQINIGLGLIPADPDGITQIGGQSWDNTPLKFVGTYTEGGHAIQSDASPFPDDTFLRGHPAGCFEGNSYPPAGTYHFFQVLIAR